VRPALLGAGSGLALLPILPAWVSPSLAAQLALGCMALGLLMPLLPWTRLPRIALLTPLVCVFPVIFVGGGLIDGAIDYYSLFLPLAFIYAGLVFPPRYCGWMFLCCLVGLGLLLLRDQPESAVPFVLLGSVLSTVCGMVLAVQRQSESRANQAMRQLVETASSLGAARERGHVASFVAVAVAQLLNAEHVEVRLLAEGAGEPATAIAGTSPAPRASVSELIDQVVTGAPADSSAEPSLMDDSVNDSGRQLVVPVRGSDGLLGVIVVSYGPRASREDRLAARHLELLCAEVTRVLERLRHTDALVEKARTDPLTGLGNRKVLEEALAASNAGDILVLIDLDHFKRVNDTLGHAAGDQVLVSFAEVLRQTTRAKQVITRYGGEEFAVMLPERRWRPAAGCCPTYAGSGRRPTPLSPSRPGWPCKAPARMRPLLSTGPTRRCTWPRPRGVTVTARTSGAARSRHRTCCSRRADRRYQPPLQWTLVESDV
jgi:GGDEF domain-containing protein